MDLQKVQQQGIDENMQKTTLHLLCIFCRCRVVFCVLSSLPCFCTFYRSIPTWNKLFLQLFLLFQFFWGSLDQPSNRTHFSLGYDITLQTNEFIARNKCVFTHTAIYQWLPNRTWNGHYHTTEIQKLSRCIAMSSIALNWSSRPSKWENYSRTSAYSQLVGGKLGAVCHTHVQ